MFMTALDVLIWLCTLMLLLSIRPFAADRTTWLVLVTMAGATCGAKMLRLLTQLRERKK
jgi:hypothetical protein